MKPRTVGIDLALTRFVREIDGLYVGQLTPPELAAFDEACSRGLARRVYKGAAGLMGLATVSINLTPEGGS